MSVFFTVLFYSASLVFFGGVVWRIAEYWKTPSPLIIPTTPAPKTNMGVVFRMFREVAFFESLFKANLWIWLFGMMFHAALLLVFIRHLRYITEPVWFWVGWLQPFGIYGGFVMVAGLLGLWARRFLVPRVRYISTYSDHLMLLILVALGATGLSMKFVAHTDIVGVKLFFMGLLHFDPQPLPSDPILYVHLGLAALLMIIFPFSKLLHAPGVFFSPTRNQKDTPRETRHLSPWAAELEK
jgi:nitrate reductase gamma subunit